MRQTFVAKLPIKLSGDNATCLCCRMMSCRYAEYETKLEQLRAHRKEITGLKGKTTLADYAIVRRIHIIYERATRKFRGDVRVWLKWLHFCRSSGSTRQISRVNCLTICSACPRCLQCSLQSCALKCRCKWLCLDTAQIIHTTNLTSYMLACQYVPSSGECLAALAQQTAAEANCCVRY